MRTNFFFVGSLATLTGWTRAIDLTTIAQQMREAITLAQIDAAPFAPMQEVSMWDPSFGFDPLSLAQ